jgi:hypothetical protein
VRRHRRAPSRRSLLLECAATPRCSTVARTRSSTASTGTAASCSLLRTRRRARHSSLPSQGVPRHASVQAQAAARRRLLPRPEEAQAPRHDPRRRAGPSPPSPGGDSDAEARRRSTRVCRAPVLLDTSPLPSPRRPRRGWFEWGHTEGEQG